MKNRTLKEVEEKYIPLLDAAILRPEKANVISHVIKSYYEESFARVSFPGENGEIVDITASFDNVHRHGSVSPKSDFVCDGFVTIHYPDGSSSVFLSEKIAERVINLANKA